jgi:hypothetical protein
MLTWEKFGGVVPVAWINGDVLYADDEDYGARS